MKLSEEMAVRLHRMMWSDMQRDLGNDPDGDYRLSYKRKWIEKHFGEDIKVANTCFLCDYAGQFSEYEPYCRSKVCSEHCPIQWPEYDCSRSLADDGVHYLFSPISDILALPARNPSLDSVEADSGYHKFRERLLSKASGIPASSAIDDHVKAIVKKAVEGKDRQLKSDCDMMTLAYCNAKKKLSEVSGLEDFCTTEEHIKTIQEKAVEEYFEKQPAAKMVSMDVDDAFKQYADEQKAPIFRALAEASGLSSGNESVDAHISEISNKAKQNGRLERSEELFKALSVYSGVSKDDWRLQDHVEAIQEKAVKEMEPLKQMNDRLTKRHIEVKHSLAQESGLDHGRPVADHIKKIRDDAFSDGENAERDRIQEKIYEVLLS